MSNIINIGGGAGGGGDASKRELTWSEYEQLSEAEKNNGTMYFCTDVNGDGSEFQPICYSETEREIGVWKDGRPLYEKCYALQSAIAFTQNAWISTTISASSMSTLVDCVLMYNSAAYTPTFTKIEDNVVQVYNGASVLFRFDTVILRYTKTTDTAGSGTWTPQGVPAHHYSTDEQVVGTWIDGNTLYEKTVDIGTLPNATSKQVAHTISDISEIVFSQGYAKNSAGTTLPLPYCDTTLSYNININVNLTNINIITGIDRSSFSGYITIRYTKAST